MVMFHMPSCFLSAVPSAFPPALPVPPPSRGPSPRRPARILMTLLFEATKTDRFFLGVLFGLALMENIYETLIKMDELIWIANEIRHVMRIENLNHMFIHFGIHWNESSSLLRWKLFKDWGLNRQDQGYEFGHHKFVPYCNKWTWRVPI